MLTLLVNQVTLTKYASKYVAINFGTWYSDNTMFFNMWYVNTLISF